MLYCNPCKDENDWPESFHRCHGPCEVCGKSRDCNDVPSEALFPPKVKVLADDRS